VIVWLTAGGRAIVRWRSPTAAPGARLAVAGEVAAADALSAGPEWLAVADVICSGRTQPVSWLSGILDGYPGCAVVAAPAPGGGYAVAARAHRPFTIGLLTPNELGLRVQPDPRRSDALACAVFVHGWLAAGWPLVALKPARLEAGAGWPYAARALTVGPAAPISFAMYYAEPVSGVEPVPGVVGTGSGSELGPGPESDPGARSASRRLTSPASGASMPE
jgi:hypothetical protein